MARFRFRPRYRALALVSIGVGGTLGIVASVLGFLALPLATGVVGIVMGGGYLVSPAWRLEVVADDAGLAVVTPKAERFRLAWTDVVRVIASATTKTCFVDGGAPERSLLIPGDGATAPYDLVDRAALYDLVIAHVAADKVMAVETIEAYQRELKAAAKAAAVGKKGSA